MVSCSNTIDEYNIKQECLDAADETVMKQECIEDDIVGDDPLEQECETGSIGDSIIIHW